MTGNSLEQDEHFTRRYNKIASLWFNNPYFSKDLDNVLKTLTRLLFRYRNAFGDMELLDHFYRFLEHTDPKLLHESLSEGQFKSKAWAAQELQKLQIVPKYCLVVGGWIGLMGQFLLQNKLCEQVLSLDLDSVILEDADLFNKPFVNEGWQFKAVHGDAFEIDYSSPHFKIFNGEDNIDFPYSADLILNTSCEHFDLKKWRALLPANTLLLLQASDDRKPEDHLFPYDNLDQFKKDADLGEILFEGSLSLRNSKRFMLIGRTS